MTKMVLHAQMRLSINFFSKVAVIFLLIPGLFVQGSFSLTLDSFISNLCLIHELRTPNATQATRLTGSACR